MNYNPQQTEKKWRKIWEKQKTFQVDLKKAKKPYYNLMMFPYPSAEGLHVGNVYAFTGSDIHGRFQKMKGFDVFEPIGFDAFGIHSENFAIKRGIHPKILIKKNTAHFREQLKSLGCLFDWAHEVDTTKPGYYKWTQWLFLQLFKAGLAYRKKAPVDWCPSCKTVLADEQVIQGKCERCDSGVVRKETEQWFFKITKYAEKLLKNLEKIDWSERTKLAQKNWIGRSEGAQIEFKIQNSNLKISVFTTRPDTLFGATYMVVAPEHEIIPSLKSQISNFEEVENYAKEARKKSELERTELVKDKTGVELKGIKAINPANQEKIPVFVADYVLSSYGTGAIMAVPAHDQRDFDFAKKYNLPIKMVICPNYPKPLCPILDKAYEGEGYLVGSGKFDGMPFEKAKREITKFVGGKKTINYHLRDWLISRQRYWGPPIPIIYCDKCAKKPKVLLIHGIEGNSKENWFPWFKAETEKKGYEVLIPDLPHSNQPDMKEWLLALRKIGIKKENRLFVVGHSLGAPVACQFIKQTKLQVEKMIFVAPTGMAQGSKNWDNMKKAGLNETGIKIIGDFNSQNTGLSTIKNLIGKTALYLSDNDPYIPLGVQNDYKELKPEVKIFKNKGHFNTSAGVTRLPEIIDEFPEIDTMAGVVPVPEKDLPVLLPFAKNFRPEGTGQSPLASVKSFVNTKCPKCKGPAKRETDVSDTFLDSSWYHIRYPSTRSVRSGQVPFDKVLTKKWLPVNTYIGGQEHAVLHLLYSRFVTMALNDLKLVDFAEPFTKFRAHGLITKGGAKMSKSKGNVVNPDDYYQKYGADALRMYLMFMGPFEQGGDWQDQGITGISRFLEKVWNYLSKSKKYLSKKNFNSWMRGEWKGTPQEVKILINQSIKKITEDLENLKFNTAISQLMILLNEFYEEPKEYEGGDETGGGKIIEKSDFEKFLLLLSPFAPHLAEETWNKQLKHKKSIFTEKWPDYKVALIKEEKITLIVQVNGKVRDKIEVEAGISKDEAKKLTLASEKVKTWISGKEIKKIIFVPNKLINVVI